MELKTERGEYLALLLIVTDTGETIQIGQVLLDWADSLKLAEEEK